MAACFSCKKEIKFTGKPGRGDSCHSCGSDIKVCLNCRFYDANSYNECREPSADRVVDKDRANFCEFFELTGAQSAFKKADPLESLKDLFKS